MPVQHAPGAGAGPERKSEAWQEEKGRVGRESNQQNKKKSRTEKGKPRWQHLLATIGKGKVGLFGQPMEKKKVKYGWPKSQPWD